MKAILKKIEKDANSLGYSAFIVGGTVRDIILGVRNFDLDIVVEGPPDRTPGEQGSVIRAGDAIRLGRLIARGLSGTIVIHERFGTCTVVAKDGLKIDFATARKEAYERPGALPTVESSSIKDDLARRDFTINAMAISLNKENFGRLIDFFGGRRDLANGRIKVLHDKSFIDDPTRIFRCIRFESRPGFSIEAKTLRLAKEAIKKGMPQKVSAQRIRNELILILKEEGRLKALERLSSLGALRFIHPELRLDKKIKASLKSAGSDKKESDDWLRYLIVLLRPLSYNSTLALCNNFSLRRSDKAKILAAKKTGGKPINKVCT
jgi:tRNA nucleotidyltransferase (CCA-adding enzyme)